MALTTAAPCVCTAFSLVIAQAVAALMTGEQKSDTSKTGE
jgi:hypothetical protein